MVCMDKQHSSLFSPARILVTNVCSFFATEMVLNKSIDKAYVTIHAPAQ